MERVSVSIDIHDIYPMYVARVYAEPRVLCRDYSGETAWEAVRTALKATVIILQELSK